MWRVPLWTNGSAVRLPGECSRCCPVDRSKPPIGLRVARATVTGSIAPILAQPSERQVPALAESASAGLEVPDDLRVIADVDPARLLFGTDIPFKMLTGEERWGSG